MLPNGSLIGVNPYEVFPQIALIAARHGIMLSETPTADEIQNILFTKLGKGKVYGDNADQLELGDEIYEDTSYLEAMQSMLTPVGIRSVHGAGAPQGKFAELALGGTVNWMIRRAKESYRQPFLAEQIFYLAGNRPVNDNAGTPGSLVSDFIYNYGVMPPEYVMLARIRMIEQGVRPVGFAINDDLDASVQMLFKEHPELADGTIYIALNAAGVNMAFQVRRKIREMFPNFDSDPGNPQLFFSADGFKIARSPMQANDPAMHQRPKTFLSFIPRLVNELSQLQS